MKNQQFLLDRNISKTFLTIIFAFAFITLQSQSRIGIKTSLGFKLNNSESVLHSSDNIRYTDRVEFLGESTTKSLGLFVRKQSDFIFLEADVMYSTYQSSFSIQDLNQFGSGISDIPGEFINTNELTTYTDTYHNIDFSLLAGYTRNNFDFGVGPIFHRTISIDSELAQLEGYASTRKILDPGFQFKIGYNLGPLNIGVKYEDYFLKAGDHFTLDTKKLKFNSGLNAIKLELAYGF